MILVFDEQTDIPNSVPFPIQVPMELVRTVFPTRSQQVGDRIISFEKPLVDVGP